MFSKKVWKRTLVAVVFLAPYVALLLLVPDTFGKKKKKEKAEGAFICAINCMDGRVQEDTVEDYLKEHYGADYVDMITEAGPDKILAKHGQDQEAIIQNIKNRLAVSVHHHHVSVVAIVGHSGCAGNPVGKDEHIANLRNAKEMVDSFGFDIKVILLWVELGQEAELIE